MYYAALGNQLEGSFYLIQNKIENARIQIRVRAVRKVDEINSKQICENIVVLDK